jgi:hypothetical protein
MDIHSSGARRKEKMVCREPTETSLEGEEPTTVYMEYETEYREVSKEHAAVENDKAPSKRHRDRNLTAERRWKPKELTRGYC